MQPVLFSVAEACQGNPRWIRVGSSICYCRNTFIRNDSSKLNNSSSPRYFSSQIFKVDFLSMKYREYIILLVKKRIIHLFSIAVGYFSFQTLLLGVIFIYLTLSCPTMGIKKLKLHLKS